MTIMPNGEPHAALAQPAPTLRLERRNATAIQIPSTSSEVAVPS